MTKTLKNLTNTKTITRGHKLRIIALAAELTKAKEALAQHEREAAQQVHMHTKSWSQDPDTIRATHKKAVETIFDAADEALSDGVRYDHIVRWSGNYLQYNKSLKEFV